MEPQRVFGALAENPAHEIDVPASVAALQEEREIEALVPVPAGHQRRVALFARGENLIQRARQKVSIDDRAKA